MTRRLLTVFTSAFLLAASSVYAQDAASTPFRDTQPPVEAATPAAAQPPPPSPTPIETPRPTEIPKAPEQSSAAPETAPAASAARPAAKPLISPVRAVPTRAATPRPPTKVERDDEERRPSSRESRSNDAGGDAADTVKTLEREWESAISKHDPSIIERVVADDFVGVSSTGRIGDKFTLVREAKRDTNVYKTATARQMTVHTYGSKVAVVMGLTRESGTTSAGRPFDHSYRFTDTWMEREGKWQCIAAHAAVAGRR